MSPGMGGGKCMGGGNPWKSGGRMGGGGPPANMAAIAAAVDTS